MDQGAQRVWLICCSCWKMDGVTGTNVTCGRLGAVLYFTVCMPPSALEVHGIGQHNSHGPRVTARMTDVCVFLLCCKLIVRLPSPPSALTSRPPCLCPPRSLFLCFSMARAEASSSAQTAWGKAKVGRVLFPVHRSGGQGDALASCGHCTNLPWGAASATELSTTQVERAYGSHTCNVWC